MNTKFIAEVSSNHNQSFDRCKKFVELASKIGCYAVKFQLFKIEELFSNEILSKSKLHRERKDWELPLNYLEPIYKICKQNNIKFACTPFYLNAVDELNPYVDFFKIASYELLWDDLLIKCAKTGNHIIISTGMATTKVIPNLRCMPKSAYSGNLAFFRAAKLRFFQNSPKLSWIPGIFKGKARGLFGIGIKS